jgi:hypothetical protein
MAEDKITVPYAVDTDEGTDAREARLDKHQMGYVLGDALEVVRTADAGGSDLWDKIAVLRETLQYHGLYEEE